FLLGCVDVFDTPARLVFVSELVGPRLLANAVALNSAVFTSSRMIGPTVAGIVIATAGTGWCFFYNGLSFFAVIAAFLAMRTHRLLVYAALAFGALLVLAGLAPSLPVELVVLVPAGAAVVTCQAAGNTLMQLTADPAFRGRVMSLYITFWKGTTPFGSLLVGW